MSSPAHRKLYISTMNKQDWIAQRISKEQLGLEIGPFMQPLVPKSAGYNCRIFDVFDTETLRQRATADINISNDLIPNIEDVDLVGSSSDIETIVSQKYELGSFSYVVSSHNFEHCPNPVSFLRGCSKVLRDDGRLLMAIPDCRSTFDYFRPHSTLADVLEAYFENRTRPTLKQWFEHLSLHSRSVVGEHEAIAFNLSTDPNSVVPFETLEQAFNHWKQWLDQPTDAYLDNHCFVFTPSSLELILLDLKHLGLISFDILEVSEPSGCEFFVELRPTRSVAMIDGAFYARRREVMRRVKEEIGWHPGA